MREYVIIKVRTDRRTVWQVRKRGRVFWVEVGDFRTRWQAAQAVFTNGGFCMEPYQELVIDRRSLRLMLRCWFWKIRRKVRKTRVK